MFEVFTISLLTLECLVKNCLSGLTSASTRKVDSNACIDSVRQCVQRNLRQKSRQVPSNGCGRCYSRDPAGVILHGIFDQ